MKLLMIIVVVLVAIGSIIIIRNTRADLKRYRGGECEVPMVDESALEKTYLRGSVSLLQKRLLAQTIRRRT